MLGWLDPLFLLKTFGYAGIFFIIFAESGLFFGFFFPGDSLLFTAGFLASTNPPLFDIAPLVIGCFIAAVAGVQVGYVFGYRLGRPLFERPDSRFFKKKHLMAAEAYYEKHGGKTIILARFIPIVRTFAPIVAGAARMDYRQFLLYNIAGGLLWAVGVTLAGYFLGRLIPDVDRYLLPIIIGIIVVSLLPSAWHVYSARRQGSH